MVINASKKVRKGLIIASKHTKTRQMMFKAILLKLETSLFHPPLFFEKFIFQTIMLIIYWEFTKKTMSIVRFF